MLSGSRGNCPARNDNMAREVEISSLDVRYESYRMRNPGLEARLLASIMERGIEEPLEGVESGGRSLLLNGFKRYRCARRLGLGKVPYLSLGEDETRGILELLRVSNQKALSILEQARFISDLKQSHHLTVAEIAEELDRSKGWVSMRLGLLKEMSEGVREKLFSGAFPVYSYMYTVRRFMRMNRAGTEEIEVFVAGVSGKKLSVREIEYLALGYFRGPDSLRREIAEGKVVLPLERLKEQAREADGCNEFERTLLGDLEILHKYMLRVMSKSADRRLQTRAFHAQAQLLSAGVLARARAFLQTLRLLHDRSGQA